MQEATNHKEPATLNYYPHHLGDYDGATAHLSWDEDMAYSRLLRAYYRREKPIPLDPGETFRLVRANSAVQKKAVSTVLEEFFYELPDGWHNKRADEEIAKAVEKGMKAKVSAGKRWHPDIDANAMPTHSERIAEAVLKPDAKAMLPITNSQEPIANSQEKNKNTVGQEVPDPQPLRVNGHNRESLQSAREVLTFLNEKTGRNYEPVPANLEMIVARLKEGATVTDLRQVVAKKCREWIGDAKMSEFLRPKTLFNRTNFANYKGELINVPG